MSLVKTVNSIDNLPLNDRERKKYQKDISNIYQIGIVSDENLALDFAKDLRDEIERNLIIRKKKILFKPVIITNIIQIVIMLLLYKLLFANDILLAIIFGSIGGILSSIYQNNKFDIDYNVDDELLYFESFKLIILTQILSIIGYVLIDSGIILESIIKSESGKDIKKIIYIISGYSQTFIPNMLKNFETKNLNGNK